MHSLLAPSSAHIWGPVDGCPAHPKIALSYPDEETEDSRKGDAAHWLGSEMIKARVIHNCGVPLRRDNIVAPNGVVIDDDIYDSAQVYARDVVVTVDGLKTTGQLHDTLYVEHRIDIPVIHSSCFGTPDCFIVTKNSIHIWDFKNGHIPVDPFQNWQCIAYLAGIFKGDGLDDQRTNVFITVVQPNSYDHQGPVKKWACKMSDIRNQITIMQQSAIEVHKENPTTRSGSHCVYCPARFTCDTARRGGMALYEAVGCESVFQMSEDVTTLATNYAIVSRAMEQMGAIEKGLKQKIESLLKSGTPVPGFCLEPTFGRQAWSQPYEAVASMGDSFGIDLRKPTLITPKKAIERGVDAEMVKMYSNTPSTGGKIVPDVTNKVRRIFFNGTD